jgi:hypothetical protein
MVPCHFLAQKWHKFIGVNNVKFQFIYDFSPQFVDQGKDPEPDLDRCL